MPGLREGRRLYRSKRYDLALAELLSAESGGDDEEEFNLELAYYLGLCYTKLERYDDALLYLEQVVTASDDFVRAYQCRLALAYIYSITGRAKLAEFELKQLVEAGYESAQVRCALAYSLYNQGRAEDAVAQYEKALAVDPANATALNSLGYILADEGIDPRRALSLCRRAVAAKPQSAAYLDSLGWACFKCGDLAEARSSLRKANELAPRNRVIIEHVRAALGEAT